MKKFCFLLFMLVLICGCSNINKISIDEILNNSLNGKKAHVNSVRVGYKYYKPALMSVTSKSDYNEVLRCNGFNYYLYVDLVSYYNKTNNSYLQNDISYYSKEIIDKNGYGYIEINEIKDNEYLIEIMYNYAKIEVKVDKENINQAVAYSLSVLTSIKYSDKIIENLMGKDVLNTHEEIVNIFETKGNEKKHLEYVEDSKYDKDILPDMDLVN